jgi:homocysteine S-methyltransferase
VPGDRLSPEQYADYHRPQLASFAEAGADLATALTLVGADEAIGVVAAAREVGLQIAVSFTVETDGALADGTRLGSAMEEVDAAGGPDWFLVNCAHPTHVARALEGEGPWERIAGLRPNASQMSHAELDEAAELDEGDPQELQSSLRAMVSSLPGLRILGGCCGTDARHVAALWGV